MEEIKRNWRRIEGERVKERKQEKTSCLESENVWSLNLCFLAVRNLVMSTDDIHATVLDNEEVYHNEDVTI